MSPLIGRFLFGPTEAPELPPVELQYPPGVFRTRSYIDPVMVALQGGVKDTNFEVVKLASFDDNGVAFFNDIAKFQKDVDYAFLQSLQFAEVGSFGSIAAKMSWLVNHEGTADRPYWMKGTETLWFGTILFGRQLVKVDVNADGEPMEYIVSGKYPGRDREELITFYHVEGLPEELEGSASHASHPWYIQQCTAIENGKTTDTPRGAVHFHPVWRDERYPTNYGDGRNYVAKEFLTPADSHPALPQIRESAEFGGGG